MRDLTAHERRIARRLEGRGLAGLGEALGRIRGVRFGGHYVMESLFAVGAEGAVFLAQDVREGDRTARHVAKIPLLLFHRPITLDSESIRRRRLALREEGRHLAESASPYMPRSDGVHDMVNPLLDPARGGAFAEPEPVLVMERLPGCDLDAWLARMHRSDVDLRLLRRTLDSVAVAVLQGLWDLQERGFYYADLRPGNVRIGGRDRRARLLDAGSMVRRDDCSGRFPHVPAYLPPDIFHDIRMNLNRPYPTAAIQAVMAGRTLFEVATGRVPTPGEQVDLAQLWDSRVSEPVADTVDGLCSGSFSDVRQALKYLHKHAARRVKSRLVTVGGGGPTNELVLEEASPAPPAPRRAAPVTMPVPESGPAHVVAPRAPARREEAILPPRPVRRPWWRRLFGG